MASIVPVPPSVAIFRSSLFRPSEPFIHEQAAALTRFRPVFVGRAAETPPPPGAAVHLLSRRHGRWGAAARHTLQLLAGWDPYDALLPELPGLAVVHAHFGPDAALALSFARARGLPLVTTFHGLDAVFSAATMLASGRPGLMSYALRRSRLRRRGTLFLCVSDFLRGKLLALGFPPERTVTHFIGVDCAFFAPKADSGEATDGGGPVILHVARLVEVKGTSVLIHAFAAVREHRPDARLVVIGDGPLRGRLTTLAERLGVGDGVRFLGTQPRPVVRSWLQRAAVFCLPSCPTPDGEEEGFGLSAVEAAACGVPVVVTRCGGLPETLQPGRTGLLVAPHDPGALAHALDTILGTERLRREMAANARRMAVQSFDIRRQTAALEEHYRQALVAPPPGGHR